MRAKEKRGRKKRQIGIRWKMYAILIVFVGIVLGVLWFFQAQMIHFFYQTSKFNELELSAASLAADLENPARLQDTAQRNASEYYADIWVYRVSAHRADPILRANGSKADEVPLLTQKFSHLYSQAKLNGGAYIALVPLESFYHSVELEILDDNMGDEGGYPFMPNFSERVVAVYVGIRMQDHAEYMILQSTELSPMSSMMNTLRDQTIWFCMILAVLALIMAFIMSRLITKPIVKMNESAKQLARGNYEEPFVGKGYREINELAESMNYASTELAKTDRLQKELISNISHDLRTPLTMIKGYSEVMRDIPGENTPENIQIVIDETSRLSELVNDMLDLSRIQAGTRLPEFQAFSLTETVRDTILRYERLTMQDGYRIEFLCDEDAVVMADRGMILQVVYNLINNAINYCGEDRRVVVAQQVLEDSVRISVTDTGEGIPESQIGAIWDRYYRVDKVHKRATVGTGLGLSIVKGILELHNASYGVQSAEGRGSVFWFELKKYHDI